MGFIGPAKRQNYATQPGSPSACRVSFNNVYTLCTVLLAMKSVRWWEGRKAETKYAVLKSAFFSSLCLCAQEMGLERGVHCPIRLPSKSSDVPYKPNEHGRDSLNTRRLQTAKGIAAPSESLNISLFFEMPNHGTGSPISDTRLGPNHQYLP